MAKVYTKRIAPRGPEHRPTRSSKRRERRGSADARRDGRWRAGGGRFAVRGGPLRGAHVPGAGRCRHRARGPCRQHRVLGGRHRPDGGLAGGALVPGWGPGRGEGGRVHRRLPADPGSGHPGRPVRAGQDRDPRRHGPRPAPGRLDRLDDPRGRGRPQRGRLRPPGRDRHRRRPRPATRELPQGPQGLPEAGGPGLRRGPRADDLRQLGQPARHDQRDRGAVPRLDRCRALLRRVLLHRGQRRHPDRVGHGRQLVRAKRVPQGGVLLGAGLVGRGLRRLLPDRRPQRRVGRGQGGVARTEPEGTCQITFATMRDQGAEAIVYMGYGYSTFHFARAFKALGWDPPRFMGTAFMFYSNSQRMGRGPRGLARRRPVGGGRSQPQLQRDARAVRGEVRARLPQRRRGPRLRHGTRRHAGDRQRQHRRCPRRSRPASSGSSGCPAPTAGRAAT